MKQAWVEFNPEPWIGLVGVHKAERLWLDVPPEEWDPPVHPIPGMGYPRIHVEFDGFVFQFVSTTEMEHAAGVLAQSLVDRETSQERWYRKLPASMKAKHARLRVAALIRRAAAAYEAQVGEMARLPSPVPQGSRRGTVTRADIRL